MKIFSLQIATIALYEMRMQWRRRTLIIFSAIFLLALGIVAFPQIKQTGRFSLNTILLAMPSAVLILVAIVPVLTAELIPLDRQYRIYDLIRAHSLSRGAYLAGKVLSVWGAVLVGGCLCNGGVFIAALLNSESFLVTDFIGLWLRLLPFILLPAGITVLVAGVMATRRQATLLGLLITPFFLVHYVLSMKEPSTLPALWAALLFYMMVTGGLVQLHLTLVEG
jgi:hypothetical protein